MSNLHLVPTERSQSQFVGLSQMKRLSLASPVINLPNYYMNDSREYL